MAAATFYTYSPPAPPGQAGYPAYLPVTIVGVAVSVCVVSNLVLAHSRAQSRTPTGVSRRLKLRRLALYSRVLTDLSSETKPTFFSNEELIKYLSSKKEGHYSDINPRGRQPGTDPWGVTYVRI